MDLSLDSMVKDEDIAYDEIVREIGDIGLKEMKNKKLRELFMEKINQLMRLLHDEEIYEFEEVQGG